MISAILLAAGSGERFGGEKQFVEIQNKPLFNYSLDVLSDFEKIEEIFLVIPPNKNLSVFQEKVFKQFSQKVQVVLGGKTRSQSVAKAIEMLNPRTKLVLIHDSARPLLNDSQLNCLIDSIQSYDGATMVRPIYDTVKRINPGQPISIVKREGLYAVETPQVFKSESLKKTMSATKKFDEIFTDETSALERLDMKVLHIPNKDFNLKITTKDDIAIAEQFLQKQLQYSIGLDYHSIEPGEGVRIGGVDISCEIQTKAHSDGDVLLHAIIDALFGALSNKDIGEHFPSNKNNKNIDSKKMLEEALNQFKESYNIYFIDATITLNSPKISQYRSEIITNVAKLLGISKNNVSIKAITRNGLNFIDFKEGWGAEVILTFGK